MKVKVKEFYVNFDENSIKAVFSVRKFFPIKEDGFDKIVEDIKEYWLGLESVELIRNKDIELCIKMKKLSDEELKERNIEKNIPFQIDAVAHIKMLERLFKVYL